MRLRVTFAVSIVAILSAWGVLRAQKPFKEYPAIEYYNFPKPSDWQDKHEWVRARLRYHDIFGYPDRTLYYRNGDVFPGYWTMDYPRSDRHLLAGIRRLTRIDARSVEQVVSLDGSDDIYNWPIVYGVEVGHWDLRDADAQQLRDFLNRGGFFMCDDFHGTEPYRGVPEWDTFVRSMSKVLPGRQIEDIPDGDPIFHTLFDLQDRFQVPGAQFLETGQTYEDGETGKVPHWRCIRDDKGRIVVAICHNMDLGDAWEHADNPQYPEKYSSLAYRIAANYFVYDLTH
ncbi:MAG TPA: DUF4159 domain-containing protein [Bryobacteraceae bacterium]|nr:DUF4159 domain-containing protein [Bryobacteraceae bacterium]